MSDKQANTEDRGWSGYVGTAVDSIAAYGLIGKLSKTFEKGRCSRKHHHQARGSKSRNLVGHAWANTSQIGKSGACRSLFWTLGDGLKQRQQSETARVS